MGWLIGHDASRPCARKEGKGKKASRSIKILLHFEDYFKPRLVSLST
jgi:hypothetical protein